MSGGGGTGMTLISDDSISRVRRDFQVEEVDTWTDYLEYETSTGAYSPGYRGGWLFRELWEEEARVWCSPGGNAGRKADGGDQETYGIVRQCYLVDEVYGKLQHLPLAGYR